MDFEKYKGKKALIKSTGEIGTIDRVRSLRGQYGMSARFIVVDEDLKEHELMPHEIELQDE